MRCKQGWQSNRSDSAMRHVILLAASALLLAACATGGIPRETRDDPGRCVFLFEQYDAAVAAFPNDRVSARTGRYIVSPAVQRQIMLLRSGDCLTMNDELEGMEAALAALMPFTRSGGGAPIRAVPVHAGIVTSTSAETRAVAYFSALGYPVRTVGAPQLGRRILIGPFSSQDALDQALSVARQAGFASPYPATRIRF
jgi:hypothetical protein